MHVVGALAALPVYNVTHSDDSLQAALRLSEQYVTFTAARHAGS